jgi:hypothetical protein
MKKNVKLALGSIAIVAIVYYAYKQMNPAIVSTPTKRYYSGPVGDRVGFAAGGYVDKGNLYNRNHRYGMTGQQTFFTNHSEKLNY